MGLFTMLRPMLVLALVTGAAFGAEPARVLLIHSFGRDFAPFDTFSGQFRTELARQAPRPIDFYEVALESARFHDTLQEGPLVDYLRALFAGRRLDLVVPIGGPAVRFAQQHRASLFPATPMLLAGTDQRHLDPATLTSNDTAVTVLIDLRRMMENILQVLPQTTNLAVVVGHSAIEQFWLGELRRQFQPFTNRVHVVWFNELPFAEMLNRSAALPPRSAILFALLAVDADGVPHLEERALARLHEVAKAPIFGLHDVQLGRGIVGGPLTAIDVLSRNTAQVAVRLLSGEQPDHIKLPPQEPGRPQFDWRELQRWGISEARLPAGSLIHFRQPTVWDLYQGQIIAIIFLCLLGTVLIALLVFNISQRRRTEKAARDLSGRLINAQEEERARLARELHDDITQRLARLAIDVGRCDLGTSQCPWPETAREVREGLVRLSEDVHSLSYRLHPSVLEDLGLTEALKAEGERFTRRESTPVAVKLRDIPEPVPRDVALCLFRVAQEALRNVARHAQARTVEVLLRGLDGGLQLAVQDDGCGFDPAVQRHRPSLGLASMRERVHLLGGELDIDTAPGRGTTIVAWVPGGEGKAKG